MIPWQTQEQPLEWKHAELSEMRAFLFKLKAQGLFQPEEGLAL